MKTPQQHGLGTQLVTQRAIKEGLFALDMLEIELSKKLAETQPTVR